MWGSWQEFRGSWHVQQQRRFRLEKQNFYIDAHGRFYHGTMGRAGPGVDQDSDKPLTALEP